MQLRHILHLALLISGLVVFSSCDKFDDNGPFYGYWLLTEATDADGAISPMPEQGSPWVDNANITMDYAQTITWAVRNELVMLRDHSKSEYYFLTFNRTATDLQFTSAYHNDGSNDTPIAFSDIPAEFCIPADGHFRVLTLDRKSMVLQSPNLTLTFKKN